MSRKDRVEHAMRDELAALVREVKDPRVGAAGMIGIARVECVADFSVATVYVSMYGDDAAVPKVLTGLKAASGFLRTSLGKRLQLGRPPELRFVHDRTAEMSLRLSDVVREDVAKATAAGRVDPTPATEVAPVVDDSTDGGRPTDTD